MNKMVLHCDMDSYFATVEAKYNPSLRTIPFAVCGDPEKRHGIVLSKNELAKSYGVITGEPVSLAKKKCPLLTIVKPDYKKYLKYAKLAREIYYKYTDTVIPYGLDEAWLDFSDTDYSLSDIQQFAELIRLEILYALDLSASIGISFNYIFSKLASDHAKPNRVLLINKEDYQRKVWKLPVSDLLFVGSETRHKLYQIGILSIGDLAETEPQKLFKVLGKKGYTAWQFANGDDSSFHPENNEIKSISHTITPPKDLISADDVSAVLYILAAAVSERLLKHNLKSECICILMKDNQFNKIIRQQKLKTASNHINTIFNAAYSLFTAHYPWVNPIRAVSIRADKLTNNQLEQLTLFESPSPSAIIDIDMHIKSMIAKYGMNYVENMEDKLCVEDIQF